MPFFNSPQPANVPVRPLNKGMIRNLPGQVIPLGGFRTVSGFIVQPQGLLRRPGYTTYALNQTIPYTMVDMLTLWKTDGGQLTFLISDIFLYKVGLITGYSPVWWTYDTGALAMSGLLAVGSSTLWDTNGIAAGDYLGISSAKGQTRITTVPDTAGSLNGDYFYFDSLDTDYYVWFNGTGVAGQGDPTVVDRTGIEVSYDSGSGVTTMAAALSGAMGALTDFVCTAVSSQVTVTQYYYGRTDDPSDPLSMGLTFSELVVGADSSLLVEIIDVESNSLLTVTDNTLGDYPSSTNYIIRRAFKASDPHLTDWVVHLNELILCGKEIPLLTYNESSEDLEEYLTSAALYPTTGEFKANTVASFADRVFVGNLDDGSDGDRRQRIRWSKATNSRDFSTTTAYLDLPYVSGELKRLLPMGDILVAYFDDAIFFGTKTGVPELPVAFQKVETGNKGLLGAKAVVSWLDGHFCVMQDDFYFVSSRGVEPLEAPIVKETIDQCREPWRVYAVVDPVRERIVFGFPSSNNYMEKLWSYEYRTNAWSYMPMETWMIANPLVNVNLTWDDLSGTTWDDLDLSAPTWDDLNINDPRRKFYAESSNALWVMTDDDATDPEGTAIQTIVESGDLDLNEPDKNKVVTRLSVKIDADETLEETLLFYVDTSVDRGRNWVRKGTIEILPGEDEGYVNFRAIGSTFRFRLTSSSAVSSYHISEYVLKLTPGGGEFSIGKQS